MGKESHRLRRRKHKKQRVHARRHPVKYRTWDPPPPADPVDHDAPLLWCKNNIIGVLHKHAHYQCLTRGNNG